MPPLSSRQVGPILIRHDGPAYDERGSTFACRQTDDFRHPGQGAWIDRLAGQNLHDKPCRNEALCGNLSDEVFRTCWSATCAFPLTASVRCWICSATRSSPPALTSGTCSRIAPAAAGMTG